MVDAAAHCPDDMLGFLAKLIDREGVMQINEIEVVDTFV